MNDISQSDLYIGRVLSCLDKNPLSANYGCFCRDYWHYKMAADFPSATYQSAVFSLYLAYFDKESVFYNKPDILKYIKAGVAYWQSLQNADGSFSEWYPNERSVVATAFTLWFITEACLGFDKAAIFDKKKLGTTILKAVSFLNKNIDASVINHTAGAIAALYNAYLITGDDACLKALDKHKKVLISNQHSEGWFSEYGNPDAGYQSLSIFFLASYFAKSSDQEMTPVLKSALSFLKTIVHPDKTAGGTYLSRSTEYLFRYGLMICSEYFVEATYILSNTDNSRFVNAMSVDDRYFIFFFLPDYMLSLKEEKYEIPYNVQDSFLPDSGLLIKKYNDFTLFMNLKKGGAFKLFKKDKLLFASCGYMYSYKNTMCSSHGYNFSTIDKDAFDQGRIVLRVNFQENLNKNYSSFFLLLFRIFNLTFCRFSFFDILFTKLLKKYKISSSRKASGRLTREFVFINNEIRLKDIVSFIPRGSICGHHQEAYLTFVPSSAYYAFKGKSKETNFSSVIAPLDGKDMIFEKNFK